MRRGLGVVGAGLLLGAGWGVLARAWMRLVSTDPHFSWSGTLFIIGLAAVLGTGLGVVEAARRRRARAWWRLAVLPSLLLFAGPGMPLLPAAVLGGWAASGRGPLLLRALAGAMVAAVPVLLLVVVMSDADTAGIPLVAAVVGFWVLSGLLAMGGSVVFRPWVAPVRRVSRAGVVMA